MTINKRTIITALGIVSAALVLLVIALRMNLSGEASGEAPGISAENIHDGVLTTNPPSGQVRRPGPLSRIRASRSSPTNSQQVTVSSMSPETANQIEKMFIVTENLNALLENGDNESALKEARRLAVHTNREVRMAALMGMEWIGAPAAADMLVLLNDSDSEIQREAEDAFWDAIDELDDPAIKLELLQTSLKTSTPSMRLEALDELFFLPDVLSFGVIASMLDDPDAGVQAAARDQLELIADEQFNSEQDAMIWFKQHKDELESLEEW